MVVYFLRHADAEPQAADDFQRRLTAKGLEQADKVGRFVLRYGLIPGVIVSSPVVRAVQTARAVARHLGDCDVMQEGWLACGMTPEGCLRGLRDFAAHDAVMLVGHEPDFGEAIAALVGMASPDAIKIRKASLTAVDVASLEPGAGQLQFLVPSRLM